MNTQQPNQYYGSPPPMVTHSPYPTMAMPVYGQQPQYQPPMPRKKGAGAGTWVTAIACTLGALFLGIGVGVAASDGATPASCTEALEHADTLTDESEELAELFVSALEAIEVFDVAAVEAVAVDIEDLVERRQGTLAAYETARDECVEGGGSL